MFALVRAAGALVVLFGVAEVAWGLNVLPPLDEGWWLLLALVMAALATGLAGVWAWYWRALARVLAG